MSNGRQVSIQSRHFRGSTGGSTFFVGGGALGGAHFLPSNLCDYVRPASTSTKSDSLGSIVNKLDHRETDDRLPARREMVRASPGRAHSLTPHTSMIDAHHRRTRTHPDGAHGIRMDVLSGRAFR
eukprot:1439864-Prymnesium_polylepis.1